MGDPPNIIIASRAGLTFNDFLIHMTPIVLVVLAVFVAMLPQLFRGSFSVDAERVADVMSLTEREAIRDGALLIKCGVVLVVVFAAFILHSVLHIEPSIVALVGAGVLVVVSRLERADYLSSVEWETLLFFAGLFVMVGALVKTAVIADVAQSAVQATGGNALLTAMLILGVSAPVSGIIDNIPYVATMTPIVSELAATMPSHIHPGALWWALALGADFGGNLTAVGASANVVMIGIACRAGHPSHLAIHPQGRTGHSRVHHDIRHLHLDPVLRRGLGKDGGILMSVTLTTLLIAFCLQGLVKFAVGFLVPYRTRINRIATYYRRDGPLISIYDSITLAIVVVLVALLWRSTGFRGRLCAGQRWFLL